MLSAILVTSSIWKDHCKNAKNPDKKTKGPEYEQPILLLDLPICGDFFHFIWSFILHTVSLYKKVGFQVVATSTMKVWSTIDHDAHLLP